MTILKFTSAKIDQTDEGLRFSVLLDKSDIQLARKFVMEQKQMVYEMEVKEYREGRSLSANGLYWSLIGKLSDALKISKPNMHNKMLRRYGQAEIIDGKLVYIYVLDTEEAEQKSLEADTYHIRPTSHTREGNDGKTYRIYTLLRGSSTYNTKEMSVLIDGVIDECKNVGIETMTEEQLSLLKEEWGN